MSKVVLVFDGKDQSPERVVNQFPIGSTVTSPTFQRKKNSHIKSKPVKMNEFDISSEFRDDIDSKNFNEVLDQDGLNGFT